MKKTKKILALVLTVALLAAAIGGTLAYLSDSDGDVNVMTLGSVYIEQHEYERATNADGSYKTDTIDNQTSYVLKDFTQGKPLLPSAVDVANTYFDTTRVRMTQVGSYGTMDTFVLETNAQDKFVTVENTGKTDAYVRTIVAVEVGTADPNLVRASYRATDNTDPADQAGYKTPWFKNVIGKTSIDDVNYYVYEFVYAGAQLSDGSFRHAKGVLPAGDTTYPSLCQVYITSEATNEDMVKLDGNGNGTLDILVLSQAVQAEGFADAETALDTAFGKASEKAAEWFAGEEFAVPTLVSTADEMVEALEAGDGVVLTDDVKIDPANMSNAYGTTGINIKNGQTIDGAGHTIDIKGAGGTWDSGINTTGGLIQDLTVTGSFRGIFINHNSAHSEPVILENVTIEGTVYTISCDQGMNQTLTATNSTFKGWTSYAATLGEATFIDCYFGEGSGYAYCRPYAPTTFVGCEFEAGFEMDARAAVTFENCTLDGVALTADNLATLVTSNIANATVK